MDNEEDVAKFRSLFMQLPEAVRKKEILRMYYIVMKKPMIILEDHDIGKVLKFLDTKNLIEYLWANKRIRADRSYIYKVLNGERASLYGYKIYYEREE